MAKVEQGLAGTMDDLAMETIMAKIQENSTYLDKISDQVVDAYSKPLDSLMLYISNLLTDSQTISDSELDTICLKLPATMYFVAQGQESLGIREDVSKAVKQEINNKVVSDSVGTIKDKECKAELETQQEYIVNVIYSRAYKKIKNKLDMSSEMLASVKKVISRRLFELELSNWDASGPNSGHRPMAPQD